MKTFQIADGTYRIESRIQKYDLIFVESQVNFHLFAEDGLKLAIVGSMGEALQTIGHLEHLESISGDS